MDIEDIEYDKRADRASILFVDDDVNPVMTIHISKDDMWKIHDYCKKHFSYDEKKEREKWNIAYTKAK